MNRSLYVGIPLIFVLAILQATLLARFPLLGIPLQPALLVAITWALLRGPFEALLWAFIAGMLLDLFSVGPTGATALALMVTVLLVARLRLLLPENPLLLPIVLSGIGISFHLLLYGVIIWLAGRGQGQQILAMLPGSALLNMLLSVPVYWLLFYVERFLYPRRIEA